MLKQLLEIFQKGDLASYQSVSFPVSAASVTLEKADLDKKLRLLKWPNCAASEWERTVEYGEIAKALDSRRVVTRVKKSKLGSSMVRKIDTLLWSDALQRH